MRCICLKGWIAGIIAVGYVILTMACLYLSLSNLLIITFQSQILTQVNQVSFKQTLSFIYALAKTYQAKSTS